MEVKEVVPEELRVCQQCLRKLPPVDFKRTKSRATGAYETKTGRSKICRVCSSINNNAYKVADNPPDDLVKFYQTLYDCGAILPAIGRRIIGLSDAVAPDGTKRYTAAQRLIDSVINNKSSEQAEVKQTATQVYCDVVHSMLYIDISTSLEAFITGSVSADTVYKTPDEAYDMLREFSVDDLLDFNDCSELVEEWFDVS